MKTELIKLGRLDDPEPVLQRVAKQLAKGALVAIPTETVYGIACNGDDPKAVGRLIEAKHRSSEKHFSVHLGSVEQVTDYVEDLGVIGNRLAARCWPGPLTMVVKGRNGRMVGLRVPRNRHTRDLIRYSGVKVIAPSANVSGQPPACDADMVLEYLAGQVDVVLDDGPTPFGKSSTVVRIDQSGYEILRLGALSKQSIIWGANKIIIFVCTGNTCRSPMAEGICRKLLAGRLEVKPVELEKYGYTVASAGLFAGFALEASPEAVKAGHAHGADLSNHLTQRVTPKMLRDADAVFCMTRGHLESLRQLEPRAARKVQLLDPRDKDVIDPMGGDMTRYQDCAGNIEKALKKRMKEI